MSIGTKLSRVHGDCYPREVSEHARPLVAINCLRGIKPSALFVTVPWNVVVFAAPEHAAERHNVVP